MFKSWFWYNVFYYSVLCVLVAALVGCAVHFNDIANAITVYFQL